MPKDSKALTDLGLEELDVQSASEATDYIIHINPNTFEPELVLISGIVGLAPGAIVGVTATAAEINLNDNQVAAAVFTVGAEAASVINVGIQLNDAAGTAMATASAVRLYLADDAAGLDVATTPPDTTLAIGTDGSLSPSGDDSLIDMLAISEADGDIDINITNLAGTPTFYMVAVLPNGKLNVSAAITFTSDT